MNVAFLYAKVLNTYDSSPYNFSRELGFKSPSTIYHIINGVNKISTELVERIRNSRFKNINTDWLVFGFGNQVMKNRLIYYLCFNRFRLKSPLYVPYVSMRAFLFTISIIGYSNVIPQK